MVKQINLIVGAASLLGSCATTTRETASVQAGERSGAPFFEERAGGTQAPHFRGEHFQALLN